MGINIPQFWGHEIEENENLWRIEKQVKRVCFGNPGFILEWEYYSIHVNKEDAETELASLKKFANPSSNEKYRLTSKREAILNVR